MRLIDADALLYEMVGITDGWLKPPNGWKWYEDSVRNAPTIEAEPVKHGQWIETENDKVISRISGHCSSCGWEAHLYEDDVIGMPYCPNCGAKMDSDGEHETYEP